MSPPPSHADDFTHGDHTGRIIAAKALLLTSDRKQPEMKVLKALR